MAHFDTRVVDGFQAMGDVQAFGCDLQNTPAGTLEALIAIKSDGGRLRAEYAVEYAEIMQNLRAGIKIMDLPDGTIQGICDRGVVFMTEPKDKSTAGREAALNEVFQGLADGALAGMIAMHGGIKFVCV